MPSSHPKGCECECCYGYHQKLTFAYGDGYFDVWTCDRCGEEAVCTGELQNYGAQKMTEYWIRNINDTERLNLISQCDDEKGRLAKEILKLHNRIKELEKNDKQ